MSRDPHSEECVYTPDSELRHPLRLVKSMAADMLGGRELAWRLFVRDTASQYRQSVLGYFWVILPPLTTSVVFILLNSADVLVSKDLGMSYPVYVLIGTVFFGLFTDALSAPLRTVMASKSMLVKVRFPHEALLLTAAAQTLLSFVIRIALLTVCMVFLRSDIAATLPVAIVPAMCLMLFGLMVGVLTVPLGALYQDITYGIAIVTSALMLITPVAYAPPSSGVLSTVMRYNPLSPLVLCARDAIVTGDLSQLPATLIIMVICLLLFFLGWVLFRLAVPIVVERLGSST